MPTPRQMLGMFLSAAGVLSFVTAPHAMEVREWVPVPMALLAVPADPDLGGEQV